MIKKLCLVLLLTSSIISAQKIKLYAFYTPSHKGMLQDWFLPSIQDDYEVILECYDQECATGAFMKDGWIQTMHHKVDIVIRGIEENFGSYFIHSDVDIQFFKPTQPVISKLMETYDFVIQKNDPRGNGCAGFFACRGNEKMLRLWKEVKKLMTQENIHDQNALNKLLTSNSLNVKWTFLPDEFFCGGTLSGKGWKPGRPLPFPKGIVMHHANWTIGIPNKIAQLHYVRKTVLEQKQKDKVVC